MTRIGAGFYKETEKSKFISLAIDEELLPLTITKEHLLTAFFVPKEDRKADNSPAYSLTLSLKEDRDKNAQNVNELPE